MKIEEIKDKLEKRYISLASVTLDNKPHAIAAEINKVEDNKIIITDNFMKTTIENIKNNPNVSLVLIEGENGWRIDGKAEYFDSGKWLEFVKSLKENKGFTPKGAILINIKKITELG